MSLIMLPWFGSYSPRIWRTPWFGVMLPALEAVLPGSICIYIFEVKFPFKYYFSVAYAMMHPLSKMPNHLFDHGLTDL